MGAKAERAKALFQQGYNCAQSVAVAFAPEMGLSEETAARLASAFGGRPVPPGKRQHRLPGAAGPDQ